MYDLEAKSQDWKDTVDWMKQQIENNPDAVPFKSPYILAIEEGSEMSLNFRIKDRDRAEGFLRALMYVEESKKELENLLGIQVYEVCLQPNNVTANSYVHGMLSDLFHYCVANDLIDVSTFIPATSE